MIPNDSGKNMGGNVSLSILLVKDVALFEEEHGKINLGLWGGVIPHKVYFTYNSLGVSTPKNGSIYAINIHFRVPKDRPALYASLLPYINKDVLLLVTDSNGIEKVYGSMECPLRLTIEPTPKNAPEEYNGILIFSNGTDFAPGRYLEKISYYEEVDEDDIVDDDDDEIEVGTWRYYFKNWENDTMRKLSTSMVGGLGSVDVNFVNFDAEISEELLKISMNVNPNSEEDIYDFYFSFFFPILEGVACMANFTKVRWKIFIDVDGPDIDKTELLFQDGVSLNDLNGQVLAGGPLTPASHPMFYDFTIVEHDLDYTKKDEKESTNELKIRGSLGFGEIGDGFTDNECRNLFWVFHFLVSNAETLQKADIYIEWVELL